MMIVLMLLAGWAGWSYWKLPRAVISEKSPYRAERTVAAMDNPLPVPDGATDITWGKTAMQVFNAQHTQDGTPYTQLEQHRLAGTYFTYEPNGTSRRTAIIDDTASGEQLLINEGEYIAGYRVASIERDRVYLRSGAEERLLMLSFSENNTSDSKQMSASVKNETPVLAENKYAQQIAENRWVLKKETLMAYYNEVLEDPERIASVYISLKPDYNDEQKIEGYNVDMVGEQDFFNAVGLRQGDVIRKVNSMRMVSQTRGEYFLREFVNNRLNAVVIDIERDNVPKKMIYLIR